MEIYLLLCNLSPRGRKQQLMLSLPPNKQPHLYKNNVEDHQTTNLEVLWEANQVEAHQEVFHLEEAHQEVFHLEEAHREEFRLEEVHLEEWLQ